ncbi:tail fiber protein [Burkholderia phage Bm1]
MARDVSAFGVKAYILASTTFPLGFSVESFADDDEPITLGTVQLAEAKRDVNGGFYTKGKGAIVPITLAVVAGSYEDYCLSTITRANFNSSFLRPAMDEINMTLSYQDGTIFTFTGGRMTEGHVAPSVSREQRLKGNAYTVAFDGVGSNSVGSNVAQVLGSLISYL